MRRVGRESKGPAHGPRRQTNSGEHGLHVCLGRRHHPRRAPHLGHVAHDKERVEHLDIDLGAAQLLTEGLRPRNQKGLRASVHGQERRRPLTRERAQIENESTAWATHEVGCYDARHMLRRHHIDLADRCQLVLVHLEKRDGHLMRQAYIVDKHSHVEVLDQCRQALVLLRIRIQKVHRVVARLDARVCTLKILHEVLDLVNRATHNHNVEALRCELHRKLTTNPVCRTRHDRPTAGAAHFRVRAIGRQRTSREDMNLQHHIHQIEKRRCHHSGTHTLQQRFEHGKGQRKNASLACVLMIKHGAGRSGAGDRATRFFPSRGLGTRTGPSWQLRCHRPLRRNPLPSLPLTCSCARPQRSCWSV